MDVRSYSPNVLAGFIRRNVCQSDKTLCKYLKDGNVKLFRTRLSKFKNADKKIEDVLTAIFVNYMKDMFLRELTVVTKVMLPLGFLILGGGFAMNKYLPYHHKDVAADIDFKFVPSVKNLPKNSPKYFGYIQMAKILMWYQVGRICKKFSSKNFLEKNFKDFVSKVRSTKVGKCLGISVVNPNFKRRYTLIQKKKQSRGKNVTPNNVLMDIELFAIDMHGVKYYVPSSGKIEKKSLNGLVDIAFMRKGEVGAEVLKGVTTGYGRFKSIFVAGKRFLFEDIYMLKSLNLRPDKIKKDRIRLEKFAKFVFKTPVKKTNSNKKIFNLVSQKFSKDLKMLEQRKTISKNLITKISKLSPNTFQNFTTPIPPEKLRKYIKNVNTSSASYRFNHNTKRWVKVQNKNYIKAEPMGNVKLYGYRPARDKWVPPRIIEYSKLIPFVGIKDKNLLIK